MLMELTELSLAPTLCAVEKTSANGSFSESGSNASRKRKLFSDQIFKSVPAAATQTSVDLHLKDRLPLDWEQCLDLESGRMYYLNRKTLRRSWNWPENNNQKLDLELNMSTVDSSCSEQSSGSINKSYSSGSNMVALACLNCHLLVILSKSSPSCPNCRYVHSLSTLQTQPPKAPVVKSLNTLSLLN